MHFCNNCGNMYYIRIKDNDNENNLIYYCRKCGNEDENIGKENVVVSTTNIKKNKQKFHHLINKYTKLDPTLPRINNIKCPNKSCITNQEDTKIENEIIYIRYDDENMKYVNLCVHCDTIWLNNKYT